MKKVAIISDSDLDGVASAIFCSYGLTYMNKGTEGVLYFTTPKGLESTIEEVAQHKYEFESVFITDLSPNEYMMDKLIGLKCTLIDHHKTFDRGLLSHMAVRNIVHDFSGENSAAMMTYRFFLKKLEGQPESQKFKERFKDLAKYADDFDTWKHNYSESKYIANYVDIVGPEKAFYKLNRFDEFMSIEYNIVEELIDSMMEEAVEEATEHLIKLGTIEGISTYITRIDKFHSVVMHAVMAAIEEPVILFGIDFNKMKGSIRTTSEFDVSILAKMMGGGGHEKAAGFPLDGNVVRDNLLNIGYGLMEDIGSRESA